MLQIKLSLPKDSIFFCSSLTTLYFVVLQCIRELCILNLKLRPSHLDELFSSLADIKHDGIKTNDK